MRGAMVAAACLLVVFASGCLTEKADPETDSTTATASSSVSKSGTATTTKTSTGSASTGPAGNSTNRAPTANLTASVLNGTAPVLVNFTLNGTDADGDALQWTLTDGNVTLGNGTALPATVSHNFTSAGNHTVVLTVRDGRLNATANVTIVVDEGGSAPPPAAHEDSYVVFNADGTCDAKGEFGAAGLYVHERGNPPGTAYLLGAGTWIYEEGNDIAGLQVGGAGEAAEYAGCLNPDILIF